MKKLILFLALFFFPITAAVTPQMVNPAMQDLQMPPLKPEDMKFFEELLSNFSEEELQELAKIGEKFIEEEIAAGRDPFAIFNELEQQDIPMPEKPEVPDISIAKPEQQVPVIVSDTRKIAQAKAMLEHIIELITIIRQRAESNRVFAYAVGPWVYYLDDLMYFANTLKQEKLVKYFVDDEFKDLYATFASLEQELSNLEPYFRVPEWSLSNSSYYEDLGISVTAAWPDIFNAYQKIVRDNKAEVVRKKLKEKGTPEQDIEKEISLANLRMQKAESAYKALLELEQAKQALEQILDSFSKAVHIKSIIPGSKKILEKYEPEALKIKESQEKLEEQARKAQEEITRRKPVYTPPVIDRGGGAYDYLPFISDKGNGAIPYAPHIPAPSKEKPDKSTGISQPGLDKAGTSGKKKADSDKAKKDAGAKKKAEEEKEKKPEIKDKKIEDRATKIEGAFKALVLNLEIEPSATQPALKETFKGFIKYLQQPVSTPYTQDNHPQLVKAKEIKQAFATLVSDIHKIKREIRNNLKDLDGKEKALLKQKARKLFENYKKEYFDKHLKDLLALRVTKDQKQIVVGEDLKALPKEYQYIFFGNAQDFENIDDPENKPIKDLNSDASDIIGGFWKSYQELKELIGLSKPS